MPRLWSGCWTPLSSLAFLYLIVFGSVAAFALYLGSTKYIQPSEAGVLASVEPLTAIVLSVALLGASFGVLDVLGELLRLRVRQAQHMERQPLRALAADARQPRELLDQLFQRCGKILQCLPFPYKKSGSV